MVQPKDQPIDEIYADIMQKFAGWLDDDLNGDLRGDSRKVGFCLMIFPFHDNKGRCNYISNARRSDIIRLLKDQIGKLESAEPSAASN